jgi:hypothetical protein
MNSPLDSHLSESISEMYRESGVVATWKEELEFEGAILVRRLAWAIYKHVKVSEVVVVRDRADARNSVFALDNMTGR